MTHQSWSRVISTALDRLWAGESAGSVAADYDLDPRTFVDTERRIKWLRQKLERAKKAGADTEEP